ncbi:MAG: hypothetical protein KDC05_00340 [Bacteroidales bacterium]|nr:hypothetical protein [Bacteroidales bacterium]
MLKRFLQYGYLILGLLICQLPLMAGIIQSTTDGGLWSASSTWIDDIVPITTDTVVVNGTVNLDLNTSCALLQISENGMLQNFNSGSAKLTINGGVVNYGTIRNNGFSLILYVAGDIVQEGVWSNFHTFINGYTDQHFYSPNPFSGLYLTKYNHTGNIIVHNNLELKNTAFDVNNDTLHFLEADMFTLDGGSLDQAKIIKDQAYSNGTITLFMLNGSLFQKTYLTADTIQLNGIVQFQSSPVLFKGVVVVNGTLRNHQASSYSATVDGDLINLGTVTRNVFNLNLNLKGNWMNNGSWNTNIVTLTGSNDQYLDFIQPVKSTQITLLKTSGEILAGSGFSLQSSQFNLNSDTLRFAVGNEISLSNSSLINGTVLQNPGKSALEFKLQMSNNAYLQNMKFISDSLILTGNILIRNTGNNFTGNVCNEGVIMNQPGFPGSLAVNGMLYNTGEIKNAATGTLTMDLTSHIIQSGIWTNGITNLTGDDNRLIRLNNEFSGEYLTVTGLPDTITFTTDLIFLDTDVDFASSIIMVPNYGKNFIKNGRLSNAIIIAEKAELAMPGTGYASNLVLPETDWLGNIYLDGDIECQGNLNIWGNLQNLPGNDMYVHVSGNLTNQGLVADSAGIIVINLEGDIYNNNTLAVDTIRLTGTENQKIELQNGHPVESTITVILNSGSSFEWFRNGLSLIGHPEFSGATSSALSFPGTLTGNFAGEYQCLTDMGWSRLITVDTINNQADIELKVLLEGFYDTGEMHTQLNVANSLPLSQPYEAKPWYYAGDQSVKAIPNGEVVDWILIELKDAAAAAFADKTALFERIPAFILKDGTIVGMDGENSVSFARNLQYGLYVDIIHRNHLGIMSADSLVKSAGTYQHDFTISNTTAYGQTLNDLGGVFGMISGDSNSDGAINDTDHDRFWKPFAGSQGQYDVKDLNGDGQINNLDKNELWIPNRNKYVAYPQ